MKVIICDETLRKNLTGKTLEMSFKEKLNIARHLDDLKVDIIGVGPVDDPKTDSILFRTISTFIKNVIIGRAIPNTEQLEEMNRTAKAVQAKQTQEREAEVQEAREKAERLRAIADKAYRTELGLSAEDFIALKWIETIEKKQGANIDVMVGPATSMWNVRR